MSTLGLMENPEKRISGRIELAVISDQLIPKGEVDFALIGDFPPIATLIDDQEGRIQVHAAISMIIRNFCLSLNVVRNMNDEQIFDAAMMLISTAGNYRVEDYFIMFELAKRGKLGIRILDRIDANVINQIDEAYLVKRWEASQRLTYGESDILDQLGPVERSADSKNPEDVTLGRALDKFAGSMGSTRQTIIEGREREEAKKQFKNKSE